MAKKRNWLSRSKVERMLFVRRFEKLKRNLFVTEKNDHDSVFKDWVQELFSQSLQETGSDAREDDEDSTDKEEDEPIFAISSNRGSKEGSMDKSRGKHVYL